MDAMKEIFKNGELFFYRNTRSKQNNDILYGVALGFGIGLFVGLLLQNSKLDKI